MTGQRRKVAQCVWVAAGAITAGCAGAPFHTPFDDLRDIESPVVEDAPYPTLLQAGDAVAAVGPTPDPAVGQETIASLSAAAAVMADRSRALARPVFEVDALRAEAAAVRRDAP